MRIIQIFFFALLSTASKAQVMIDTKPLSTGQLEAVVYGKEFLNERIPLNRIKGSPFWNPDWRLAQLFDSRQRLLGELPARINLASGDVHFLKDSQELVPNSTVVQKIQFLKNEKSPAVTFIVLPKPLNPNIKTNASFVQVLTTGDYQLLKATERRVSSADSLFRTQKRYFFSDETDYFLVYKNKLEQIKRLSNDFLLPHFPNTQEAQKWIKKNNVSLKKEADVIAFINWYNLQFVANGRDN